jgi:small subunit ribosomal protein S8
MVDPITDMLNRIRNASMAQHASCRVPYSKMKAQILKIMQEEGFVDSYTEDKSDGIHGELVVYLRYTDDSKTAIHSMRRISKPGRRWYSGTKEIAQVKSGLGVAIVSTSKGIMSDRDARRLNVGGEILCEVW